MRRATTAAVALALLPSLASAAILVSQPPAPAGGIARSSQLWQDPGPNGPGCAANARPYHGSHFCTTSLSG